MLHCPFCGTKVNENEMYCVKCGKQLPHDLNSRFKVKKQFNRFWYYPILTMVLFLLISGSYYLILQNKTTQAKKLYEQGENSLLNEEYQVANSFFNRALKHKENFNQAIISLDFTNNVLKIQNDLNEATHQSENLNFQQALSLVNEAENSLKNYHGTAVTKLVNTIESNRNSIKILQLKKKLTEQPSIEDLKVFLWEIESIKTEEAEEITEDIRGQIIDYAFSKASEQLNNNQFSDAQLLVEDGLKYAPDSEKLQSLNTTIDKEKTAFETTQQQRIEQAINMAAEERELNKLDAIKLDSVNYTWGEQELVVKGKVSSVATVPISSILVEYSILTKDETELLSNKVFAYPEKLFPNETGKFEFTHYDLNERRQDIKVEVNKITWYTDQ